MKNKLILVTDSLEVTQKLNTILDMNPSLMSQIEFQAFNRRGWFENLENPFLRAKLLDQPMGLPSGILDETNVVKFPFTISEHVQVVPLEELEKAAILQAIEACRGNLSLVAKLLKVGRATLYRRMKHFGIEPKEQKKKLKKRVA